MHQLKQERVAKGMTQQELADALGVRRLTVLRWESGECTPDVRTLRHLAEVLGTTVGALLGEAVATTGTEVQP